MGAVYKITNTVNGKVYVGKTMLDPSIRWKNHRACARWGYQPHNHFYRAMSKYGIENFVFEILYQSSSETEINAKEIEWIARLESTKPLRGYNHKEGGNGGRYSAEARARMMGRKRSPEASAKQAAKMRGRKLTPEHVAKIGRRRGTKYPQWEVEKNRESHLKYYREHPEAREHLRIMALNRSSEVKLKYREAALKKWSDPTYREQCLSPAKISECSEEMSAWWLAHPEAKERARERTKNRVWTEEARARLSVAVAKGWIKRREAA